MLNLNLLKLFYLSDLTQEYNSVFFADNTHVKMVLYQLSYERTREPFIFYLEMGRKAFLLNLPAVSPEFPSFPKVRTGKTRGKNHNNSRQHYANTGGIAWLESTLKTHYLKTTGLLT